MPTRMSWAQRLKAWTVGDSGPAEHPSLSELCADIAREAVRLRKHADLAPNEAAASELDRMATDQTAVAERLGEAVGLAPTAAAEAAPPTDLNHWGRLVHDLETLRSQRDRLFDAAKEVDADDPALAEVLDGLSRKIEAQLERLRALIARADPQSLN